MKHLALLLVVLLLPPKTIAAEAPTESPPLPIKPPGPRWLEGTSALGGGRHALLVGVGKYARHAIWNLDWVKHDLSLIEKCLSEKAGFQKVQKLEDDRVSKDAVATEILKIAQNLAGEDNLVLLYWVGHGYLDQSGQQRYFLAHTDEGRPGEFAPTIGQSDLAEVFQALGGKARVIFVADACRTAAMAPPAARSARKVKVADAVLYSTGEGRFAIPAKDQAHSVFAESFELALSSLSAKSSMSLQELYEGIRSRLKERRLEQTPELVAEPEVTALKIFDRANLSLGVKVIDGLSRQEIKGAVVKLAGLDRKGESPASFKGLAEGTYRLEVSLDGMFRELAEVALDEKRRGGTLEVTLLPQFLVLEGSVRNEEGKAVAGVACTLEGQRSGFLRGYHTYEATTDTAGRYRFLVPLGARIEAVSVPAGLGKKKSLPVDLAKFSAREAVAGGRLLRTYELGTLSLPASASLSVNELGLSGRDAARWREAEKFEVEGRTEDLDLAIKTYEALLPKVKKGEEGKVKGRIRRAYEELLSHYVARGLYEKGAKAAEGALKTFEGDTALQAALETCRREAIPEALRDKLAEASRAVEAGDFTQAERLYADLDGRSSELTPYYKERVKGNLGAIEDKLFEDAFAALWTAYRGGDMEKAIASFEEVKRLDPKEPTLKSWEEKLATVMDREPPTVSLLASDGREVLLGRLTVEADRFGFVVSAADKKGLRSVKVNGQEQVKAPGADLRVPLEIALKDGENRIQVEATDLSGQSATAEVVVVRKTKPPVPSAPEGFTSIGKNAQGYEEYRHDKTGIVFVLLPGGKFNMGSSPTEQNRQADEGPVHRVTLSPFLIAKHEVTQLEWERVIGTSPSYFKGDDLPVEMVTWEDCQEFCRKAGLKLPTEAQWEYACRADTIGPIAGTGRLEDMGWYDQNSGNKTHPVGQKQPNGFGLYDIHGNVWEWCEDVYDEKWYSTPAASGRDPVRTSGSGIRARRGGSWIHGAGYCRAATRVGDVPSLRDSTLGFRPSYWLQ